MYVGVRFFSSFYNYFLYLSCPFSSSLPLLSSVASASSPLLYLFRLSPLHISTLISDFVLCMCVGVSSFLLLSLFLFPMSLLALFPSFHLCLIHSFLPLPPLRPLSLPLSLPPLHPLSLPLFLFSSFTHFLAFSFILFCLMPCVFSSPILFLYALYLFLSSYPPNPLCLFLSYSLLLLPPVPLLSLLLSLLSLSSCVC